MMIKRLAYLLSLFVSALLTTSASAQDEYVFILRARGNPYWNVVRQGIEETAKVLGVRAVVYEGESDKASEEQLNLCFTAIQRRPKFLAIAAANSSIGIQCLKKAAEKGIGIGEIDGQIPLDEAAKHGLKLAFSVGSDNSNLGREAAKYAASVVGSPQANILILEGAAGAVAGNERVAGFRQSIPRLRL